EGVRPKLERGHDAEVPAAAAKSPEEVALAVLARGDHVAGREDHLRGQKVVDREPVLALQPGDASAERQTRDAGEGDAAARRGEPKGGVRTVELPNGEARLRADGSSRRVDVDA